MVWCRAVWEEAVWFVVVRRFVGFHRGLHMVGILEPLNRKP